ncbi:hypothetical protein BDU57DRAFT_487599 [Ampelomyces quisqualis]|uniref:Tr-type G domain-containing protein n=1 Tax=Ampelomyces quisqualis TaxID=50730 RepID=A0A6A5QZH9_AMPQU|nr:hypothetical protein BDU57DRAFT_487599 [Ampelomyces quisqualis]
MASIFNFDPDPPRVSSPWATPPAADPTKTPTPVRQAKLLPTKLAPPTNQATSIGSLIPITGYTNITRLEAEPQEGPTEYKLHLLLRRRRSFTRTTTGRRVSGSLRCSDITAPISIDRSVSESGILSDTPPPLASTQSKQHRLEQLTTQLLWRLQQSCSYHISSTTTAVLPHFPDGALSSPESLQRLLPGLEESKGALYEIGVADDGTIVGLAEDEMNESLNNLRAMAASLGCGVEVVRMVPVGECEWEEYRSTSEHKLHTSRLLVAEALVRPLQHLVDHTTNARQAASDVSARDDGKASTAPGMDSAHRNAEQLRVSVTGATMSGKSSLIGTLSTATLDNGRGKSRLSLLKHRHEIASGMTSSVTQELIGYRDRTECEDATSTQIIGYDSGDVSSWTDIHASVEAADNGRLVVLSDSAGHLRFRRTTVRGIVGWQPHWTLLCIPADNTDDSTGKIRASPAPQELLGPAAADLELSQAHLHLCLNLELPLVIVITKYDLATKAGLRQKLSKLLSVLKEAGRKPCILPDTTGATVEVDLHAISSEELQETGKIMEALSISPLSTAPIVLTSATRGTGMNKLHALLRQLPIPSHSNTRSESALAHLFHIEDVYSVQTRASSDMSAIIGGYLRYGKITVGDELLLGPYHVDASSDDSDSSGGRTSLRSSNLPQSRSFPGALKKTQTKDASLHDYHTEWRRVRITSLRNLRLPVRTLHADQVGTIGIVPIETRILSPAINRIRKGMVLTDLQPSASRIITVRFKGSQTRAAQGLSVGSAVVLYFASVRASSKVISVTAQQAASVKSSDAEENDEDAFGFGFEDEADEPAAATTVTFQFIASREFVEHGAKVLVMPGGGPGLSGSNERGAKGLAGLEGFVGHVFEE